MQQQLPKSETEAKEETDETHRSAIDSAEPEASSTPTIPDAKSSADEQSFSLDDQTDLQLSAPPDADEEEVAAVVAAIASHLDDERRAAVAEGEAETTPEPTVDAWKMSGRYHTDRPVRTPGSAASQSGWALSGRTHTFHL